MQLFPWFCILFIIATELATTQISQNLWIVSKILVCPFKNNWWYGTIAHCLNSRLFCSTVVVWATFAQSWFLDDDANFPPSNVALSQFYNIANFHFSLPFCWQVSGAICSKNTPGPSCLHAFSMIPSFENYDKNRMDIDKVFNAHKGKTSEWQVGASMACA